MRSCGLVTDLPHDLTLWRDPQYLTATTNGSPQETIAVYGEAVRHPFLVVQVEEHLSIGNATG